MVEVRPGGRAGTRLLGVGLLTVALAGTLACTDASDRPMPRPPEAGWSLEASPTGSLELGLGCLEVGKEGSCAVASDGSLELGLVLTRAGDRSWLCTGGAAGPLTPCADEARAFRIPAMLRDANGRGLEGARLESLRLVRADGSPPVPEGTLARVDAFALLTEPTPRGTTEFHDVAGRWLERGDSAVLAFDAPFQSPRSGALPKQAATAPPAPSTEAASARTAPRPPRRRSGAVVVDVDSQVTGTPELLLRLCTAEGRELARAPWRPDQGARKLLPFAASLDSRHLWLTAEAPSGQTLGAVRLALPISPASGLVVEAPLTVLPERRLLRLRVLADGRPAERARLRVDGEEVELLDGRGTAWWSRSDGAELEVEAPCLPPLRRQVTPGGDDHVITVEIDRPTVNCEVRPLLRSPSGKRFFASVSRVAVGLGPRLQRAVDAEYQDEAFRAQAPCPPEGTRLHYVIETSDELEDAPGVFDEDCSAEVALRYAKPVLHVILHPAGNWTTTELGDAVHFDRFKQHLHDFLREQTRARSWAERRLDVVADSSGLSPVYWSAPDRPRTLVGLEQEIRSLELARGSVPPLHEILNASADFLQERDLAEPAPDGRPSAVVVYLTGQDEVERRPGDIQASLDRLGRLGAVVFVLQLGRDDRPNPGYAPLDAQGEGRYRRLRADQEALRFFGGLFLDLTDSTTFRSLGP